MLRSCCSQFIDELAGTLLLWRVLRYRNHPPVQGDHAAHFPDLFSGELTKLFAPAPDFVPLDYLAQEVRRDDEFVVEDIRFPSPVHSGFAQSDKVHCRRWRPAGLNAPVRTIVMIDGLVQPNEKPQRLFARHAARHAWDLISIDMPFNHRRTPEGYRPGQLLTGGDVDHAFGTLRQAVLDAWTVVRSLNSKGREVSLAGISFGGWVSLTIAALDASPKSVLAITPPVDMLGTLTEGGVIVKAAQRNLNLSPEELAELRPAARAISLFEWPPQVPAEDITLVAAEYDRFIPTDRVHQLAELWGTRLIEIPRGHIECTRIKRHLNRIAREWLDSH